MRTPTLEAAFHATTYCIDTGKEIFSLRIGQPYPAFASWLARRGSSTWGIVTACNPGGQLTPSLNEARNLLLREALLERGWCQMPTHHVADSGNWPDEAGFCVLDVESSALQTLAREYGQAAIVYGGVDGAGRLVWLERENEKPAREK